MPGDTKLADKHALVDTQVRLNGFGQAWVDDWMVLRFIVNCLEGMRHRWDRGRVSDEDVIHRVMEVFGTQYDLGFPPESAEERIGRLIHVTPRMMFDCDRGMYKPGV